MTPRPSQPLEPAPIVAWYPALVALLGVLAAMLVVADAQTGLRAFVVGPFLLIAPGLAIVGLIGISDPLEHVVLAVAVSLAISIFISLAMLYGGFWSPDTAVVGLAVLVLVLTLERYRRILRKPMPGGRDLRRG